MKFHAALALIVVASLPSDRRGYAQEAPPKPAELKTLDRLVGTWDTVAVFKAAVWWPEERTVKGTVKSAWMLDGRFVREQGSSLGQKIEHSAAWTYDPRAKSFRCWYFDSMGVTNEWKGHWHEPSKTLASQAELGDGITGTSEYKFIDANHYEVTVIAKDGSGKVYMDMKAVHTRRR